MARRELKPAEPFRVTVNAKTKSDPPVPPSPEPAKTISVVAEIPQEVATQAYSILSERGLTFDAWLNVMLAALVYSKRNKMLGLKDPFKFGKYRGLTLDSVIRADPSYVAYFINKPDFQIDAEAMALLATIMGPSS